MRNLQYYDSSFNSKFSSKDIFRFCEIELGIIVLLMIVFL